MPNHSLTSSSSTTLKTGHTVRVDLKVDGPYRAVGDDYQTHWIPDDASNREIIERLKASTAAALKDFL